MLRILGAVLFCLSASAISQSTIATPASDPQALALSAAAMTALTGGSSISDVTLTGTATEIAGSTINSGAATFQAKGYGESRLDLNASQKHELRNLDANGYPQGSWTDDKGIHAAALHNTWVDAGVLFPALSSLGATARQDVVATYVGAETRAGAAVQHLRFRRQIGGQSDKEQDVIGRLSAQDIYLDAKTALPIAITFNTHPDDDSVTNLAVEIRFSDYRTVNGAQIPFHIQKFLQGNLLLDFVVSTAVLNSGLSDSVFQN